MINGTDLQVGWKIEYQTEAMSGPQKARVASLGAYVVYVCPGSMQIESVPYSAMFTVLDREVRKDQVELLGALCRKQNVPFSWKKPGLAPGDTFRRREQKRKEKACQECGKTFAALPAQKYCTECSTAVEKDRVQKAAQRKANARRREQVTTKSTRNAAATEQATRDCARPDCTNQLAVLHDNGHKNTAKYCDACLEAAHVITQHFKGTRNSTGSCRLCGDPATKMFCNFCRRIADAAYQRYHDSTENKPSPRRTGRDNPTLSTPAPAPGAALTFEVAAAGAAAATEPGAAAATEPGAAAATEPERAGAAIRLVARVTELVRLHVKAGSKLERIEAILNEEA